MLAVITAIFGLLGLSLGSFLNLCIDRLPGGKSIVNPGSHCDSCGQSLKAIDLVPLFSYLWLRGRCRRCGVRIPFRLPLVELATGAIFALLAWHFGLGLVLALALIYAAIFILILVIDLEQGLVLNVVLLPGAAIALVSSFLWHGFGDHWPALGPGFALSALLGGVAGVVLLLLPYLISRGGMGEGDVKLAGLIGMVAGFPQVFLALLLGIVGGGLVASFLLLSGMKKRKDPIPFGPFLAVGAMAVLVWGQGIIEWYRHSLVYIAFSHQLSAISRF